MKTIKIFILFVSTGLLLQPVLAQKKIVKGRVVDATYHTPVPYAALYIEGMPIGTVADNAGEFSLAIPDSLFESFSGSLSQHRLVVARERFAVRHLPLSGLLADDVDLKAQSSAGISDKHQGGRVQIALVRDNYEERIRTIQNNLMRNKGGQFKVFLTEATKFVSDEWIPLGNRETNKFDLGEIQNIPSHNPNEGMRLRLGFASNARLNPQFFIRGYVAYGFKDQELKYRGEAIYSFIPKAYHEDEFPINNLRVAYEKDLYSPGDMHPYVLNRQILFIYKRSHNEATYRNFAEVNYEREYKNGFAHIFRLRRSRFVPQGDLEFDRMSDVGESTNVDALRTTELSLLLRYKSGEAYDQLKRKRIPLDLTSPVFFLSHTIGMKDFFGGDVSFHRSEFSAQKRFILGSAGHIDAVGEVMKIWDKVPFPLLVYPNQRYRHQIENKFFFLNRSLEFMADEQYTLRMVFVANNFLLAKIPLINGLRIRELLSFRAAYGRLSDKNNPTLSPEGLYRFPSVSHLYDNTPYIEGTIGVTNILGLLRLEYVHRFTYRDHPDAVLGAFRVEVTL